MKKYNIEKLIARWLMLMLCSNAAWSATPQSLNNPDGTNPYSPYEGHPITTKPVSPLPNSSGNEISDTDWLTLQQGMLFKFERQRDEAIAGIRKADEKIVKAQNLISRAQAADNKAAETIAIRALQTAQETKRRYEQKKIQIEKNSAYVRNRMADKSGMNMKIAGMVTQHTGRVQVTSGKSPYETIPLDRDQAGYFEEGDTIETYDNSQAQIQFLDGRGSMTIGEYSRVKMEKKDPYSETISLAKGTIHTAIDKAEVFEAWIEKQAEMAADDPNKMLEYDFRAIRAWVKNKSKKFEIRTGSGTASVRGTTFTMGVDEAGTTIIELIEGELAVTNAKTSSVTILKGGEKMTLSSDGTAYVEPLKLPSQGWWEQ